MTPNLVPIDRTELPAMNIWQNRFVKEYNRSDQHREGYSLIAGIDPDAWNKTFANNVGPLWIRWGSRNIGFVSLNVCTVNNTKTGKDYTLTYVSDVYVDRAFRKRGLLAWALTCMREAGHEVICIDRKKILDNAYYYWCLGFRFATPWQEQELLMVSPQQHCDAWQRILPDTVDTVE